MILQSLTIVKDTGGGGVEKRNDSRRDDGTTSRIASESARVTNPGGPYEFWIFLRRSVLE